MLLSTVTIRPEFWRNLIVLKPSELLGDLRDVVLGPLDHAGDVLSRREVWETWANGLLSGGDGGLGGDGGHLLLVLV